MLFMPFHLVMKKSFVFFSLLHRMPITILIGPSLLMSLNLSILAMEISDVYA